MGDFKAVFADLVAYNEQDEHRYLDTLFSYAGSKVEFGDTYTDVGCNELMNVEGTLEKRPYAIEQY